MKHAFLIVAHKSPELLRLIVKKLESPNHYIPQFGIRNSA